MRCCVLFAVAGVWLAAGCGSAPRSEPVVLARTESDERAADAGPAQDLVDKVLEDDSLAADIIKDALGEKGDAELSAWAAVYALRLGIKHEAELSKKALLRGVASGDPLLQALCWRWLAGLGANPLPQWSKAKSDDPVVQAMAAMAFAEIGPVPKALESALGEPPGKPCGPDKRGEAKDRVERLLALVAPFDNGPLALAVAFAEARRAEWAEKSDDGELVWICNRLRDELAELVFEGRRDVASRIEASKPARHLSFTSLSRRLEMPLVRQPLKMIYSIALSGEPELRKDALRVIAITEQHPVSRDFGAAAAALRSTDPGVQLEGARTFLLLSIRAR